MTHAHTQRPKCVALNAICSEKASLGKSLRDPSKTSNAVVSRSSDICSFLQQQWKKVLSFLARSLSAAARCWSVAHGGGDHCFRMTDDGFHSQMPLLFVLGRPRGSPHPRSPPSSSSDNLQTSPLGSILPAERKDMKEWTGKPLSSVLRTWTRLWAFLL